MAPDEHTVASITVPDASPDVDSSPGADLGRRVRQFRELRGMSVRGLASAAGVSPSFLSQLENHHTSASVASLRKLAEALGVSVAELIDSGSGHSRGVLRAADRPSYPTGTGAKKYVVSRPPMRNLEVYSGVFEPTGTTGDDAYSHGRSQEIFIVIRGEIELVLGDETHRLAGGDSIEYLSSVPHKASNIGRDIAEVIWITSPPTDSTHA